VKRVSLVLVFVALLAGGTSALAAIAGSAHDFSSEGWSGGQICLPCHTPHNADTSVPFSPLWNHEVTTATYQVYTSPTLDATVDQPTGVSKLCLSCHDGTVALDSYGGATGVEFITGDALLGTDMSNDHPISFTYDTNLALTDGELFDPSTTASGLGGTIDADMLFDGSLECGSCHDVHNTVNPGNPHLLLIDNAASALCLTCHDK
jgi:predicted CXXCH cytochrome family protein